MGYSVYTINFLNAIGVHEIPQFRGAVISTVGRDNNLLFHFGNKLVFSPSLKGVFYGKR